jgi:hypothetical protein
MPPANITPDPPRGGGKLPDCVCARRAYCSAARCNHRDELVASCGPVRGHLPVRIAHASSRVCEWSMRRVPKDAAIGRREPGRADEHFLATSQARFGRAGGASSGSGRPSARSIVAPGESGRSGGRAEGLPFSPGGEARGSARAPERGGQSRARRNDPGLRSGQAWRGVRSPPRRAGVDGFSVGERPARGAPVRRHGRSSRRCAPRRGEDGERHRLGEWVRRREDDQRCHRRARCRRRPGPVSRTCGGQSAGDRAGLHGLSRRHGETAR